jgi:hypothetical protein
MNRFIRDGFQLYLYSLVAYVPSVAAPRGVYRSSYARPTGGYGYRPRLPPPVVPAGRGPGGAGLIAAILGPIGGLTGCLCCLNTMGVWGLFIAAIPFTVFMSESNRQLHRSIVSHCELLSDSFQFKADGCVISRVVMA